MGTRSLTHIHAEGRTSPVLVTLYCQYDGYVEGVGAQLKEFLSLVTLRNGYSPGDKEGTHANGMGCLAAQLIKHVKEGIGTWYVHEPNANDCGEEYTYNIFEEGGELGLTVADYDGKETALLSSGVKSNAEESSDVLEFVYKKSLYDEGAWRKIQVLEETQDYIAGHDLNDDAKYKKFLKSKIVGGKIIRG